MARLFKIVLTGGPCAGKTTAIEKLKNIIQGSGYIVLTIPETATFVMSNGIAYEPSMGIEFQIALSSIQKNNEDAFSRYARKLVEEKNQDVVILLDRGLMDGSVFFSEKEFAEILKTIGLPLKADLMKRYDAVLCLTTAAKGAEDSYAIEGCRLHNIDQALVVDEKTEKAWKRHPNFHVFDNENKSLEKKIREVIDTVSAIIDTPVTMKSPRKFLIDFSPSEIPSMIKTYELNVEKIFLNTDQKKSCIRKSLENSRNGIDQPGEPPEYTFIRFAESENGKSFCAKTVSLVKDQQIERMQRFDENQFSAQVAFADPTRSKITQKRILFSIEDLKFEICCYLGNEGASLRKVAQDEGLQNVLQCSRSSEGVKETISVFRPLAVLSIYRTVESNEEDFEIPGFLRVMKEVTNDFRFTSHYLSLKEKSRDYRVPSLAPVKTVRCHTVKDMVDFG